MATLPKVLLLGDSIRMSYQPHVARLLAGRAEVVGPSENCQFALYTLSSLDRWISDLGRPDVVHWNNGIHDAGYNPCRAPSQIPIDVYVSNLKFIAQRLTAITPRIIWATCTPIHPDRPFRETEWSWRPGDIERYNAAALHELQSHAVPVNDLYSLVHASRAAFLVEDGVHLTTDGQEACARAVMDAILRRLAAQ